ncbi:MAG: lipopolysaccharide heptosyltransferase II [Chlorobi bacterium]|nr:lipopolysaccharide heptosyltransferase II [Chlorobiota bacterium]
MKILIIALSGIGDALMFTPALQILKEKFPDSEIDAMVMFKGVADLYEKLPEINRIHFHDFLNSSPLKSFRFVSALRNKYDVSFNVYPSNRWEYNVIAFIAGAKRRFAIRYLRRGARNLSFINTDVIKENDYLHNVEENVKMVERLTGSAIEDIHALKFPIGAEEREKAKEFFSKNNLSEKDYIVGFHPGCSTLKNHINRRWEPEKFAELARKLIYKEHAKILIFGGPEEDELKRDIQHRVEVEDIVDVSTRNLAETAAIMERCDKFVTNDSGLMHIAAALKLKVVAIIGPTNENYIRPWKTTHRIVSLNLACAPCFYYSPKPLKCSRDDKKFKCIKNLDVTQVYNALMNV